MLPDKFYYLTCHRQENTKEDETLTQILRAMESLDHPCVYPVHPRNRERAERIVMQQSFKNIILCQPVGYLMSVYLTNNCEKIETDSGGLQREAFFAGKQCVTVFDYVAWPETMVDNRNQPVSYTHLLPLHSKLTDGQVDYITETIREVLKEYRR